MLKKLLLILALTVPTYAQNLDYYLTPQSQIDSMATSNWYATQAANAWLQYCQGLRAQGYTGQIYCPTANTQTLMQTNQELQNIYSNNNAAWSQNQQIQSNAMQNWSNGMRDSAQMQGYYVQPSAGNYQWVNPNTGQVWATPGYYPPNYSDPWQPLR